MNGPGCRPQRSVCPCPTAPDRRQYDFIRQPMVEQHRYQRGTAREDQARAVLRLDAANALGDVRPQALERAPFKTFRAAGGDKLCCRIQAVRHWTARRLGPVARPSIVGAAAQQQIEARAMRSEHRLPTSGGSVGRGPVAIGESPPSPETWITPSSEMCPMILSFLIGGLRFGA